MSVQMDSGIGRFTFTVEGEEPAHHGEKAILPTQGMLSLYLEGGVWSIGSVEISGLRLSKVDGRPTKQGSAFTYSPPFLEEDPEYRAPGWLVRFVDGLLEHLNQGGSGSVAGRFPA